jgi:diguanylate cyclase (GGDEF)-like protein
MAKRLGYGIGLRLAILLATFGIAAMGVVGYTSYASGRAALLNATQRDLLTATQVLGRGFQERIDEVSANTLMLASLPLSLKVAGAAPSDDDKTLLADTFTAMLAVHPDYFQARLISADRHGLELLRVDRDTTRLIRVGGLDLQEKAHYPYVFNTLRLARGQVYLSDITINRELGAHAGTDKPTLRVATPVVGADGAVLGLVVINIDLDSMFKSLQAELPGAYQLYLSNHWGDYLIHPDPAQAFGFDRGRRALIQSAFAPVAGIIDGQRDSVVTTRADGDGQAAAFVRLAKGSHPQSHFVILGLSQKLTNVASEARALGWKTVRIIVLLSVFAVVLAALVSRAVTGPLRQMAEAVTRFSKERVVSELPSGRNDQIGVLARSLNDMQRIIVENIRELDESRVALRHLAQHDGLTGLPNRALFDDRLQQALASARRAQVLIAVLFIDLDGFKAVNDSHGHQTGDLLLTAVAQRIQGCVREADTAGRIGGDEFVMLLNAIGGEPDALHVAEKVRAVLEQPFDLEGRVVTISASIGVALFPQHGDSERALALSADTAMYLAKGGGGNRVRLAAAKPPDAAAPRA